MKGTSKKQASKSKAQVSPLLLKEGGKPLGPGVVKRPRREAASSANAGEEPGYTPSEQVFRRR
ncbi:MAG TPA: hypothetical protein DFS52_06225 [Myxococcales bacterium]|jgi:hypothetical protein|nr:hypothetical protein [Myxococcales bacterium]